jgi:hypothetical protein
MKRRLSKYAYMALLISCLYSITSSPVAKASDVFPITPGSQFTYRHQIRFHSWSFSSYTTVEDSGLVHYFVQDSLITVDSTIIWQVLQVRDLIRHLQTRLPDVDTVLSVKDSIAFTLTEFTVGHHELFVSPLSWSSIPMLLAWSFPLTTYDTDTVHIFRFTDSAHVTQASHGYACPLA